MKRFTSKPDGHGMFNIFDDNKGKPVAHEGGALNGQALRYETRQAAEDECWHLNQIQEDKSK